MEIVQKEGTREIKRNIDFYNLDVIISVGYRVNSRKATLFRQWATKILNEYIRKGLENGFYGSKSAFCFCKRPIRPAL